MVKKSIILSFDKKSSSFIEGNKAEAEAHLELNPDGKTGTAILKFAGQAGLITRRTASRQAESVCKSGFLLSSGERVGVGNQLEVVDGDKISDIHLREGHKFNRY